MGRTADYSKSTRVRRNVSIAVDEIVVLHKARVSGIIRAINSSDQTRCRRIQTDIVIMDVSCPTALKFNTPEICIVNSTINEITGDFWSSGRNNADSRFSYCIIVINQPPS